VQIGKRLLGALRDATCRSDLDVRECSEPRVLFPLEYLKDPLKDRMRSEA